MKHSDFAAILLNWYSQHCRDLPWRSSQEPDPYRVWVSEIMLQQTRVETVIPYFERWMERFPSLASLAEASQQEALSMWEGLGYYSRARNLQRAAQIVVEQMDGKLPADPASLRELPGIGRYTAAAIASIAFGRDEAALDGNIRRVLARVFNVTEPARSPQGERRLWELSALHLPPGRAGEYNQALMDLGAMVCIPHNPRCTQCPLAEICQARALNLQEERPVGKPRRQTPHHTVTAAVIARGRQVLITQRPPDGLLGGLWEFPGGKAQPGEALDACLRREICEELGVEIEVGEQLGVYRHAYSHFRVTLHAFCCALPNGSQPRLLQVEDLRWVYPAELAGYPMGKIDRQISRDLFAQEEFPC
ncbi:MAG: A/G-specific adenine glycosylase [Anaerolineales bacterium]|nr:A/G-specific adenine glycosylase [Anaerolineales bacterium]